MSRRVNPSSVSEIAMARQSDSALASLTSASASERYRFVERLSELRFEFHSHNDHDLVLVDLGDEHDDLTLGISGEIDPANL